ncbi:protein kinase domain-containing protein [Roseburia intestinalis]|uniref:protein kinase domain-containing protein n=1 Tax=Roseburia intestinalis TaxID=166486 RepID=UPI0035216CC6
MNDLDRQILEKYYTIDEDLTAAYPDKPYRVYTAWTEHDFSPVILKEMDEKRANIYMALSGTWNPHVADVYSVLRLENSFITQGDSKKQMYLAITECICNKAENGLDMTLTNYIKTYGVFDELSALKLCIQICDGLRDIHRLGYIHKDLKPDNIMVCDTPDKSGLPLLKIIDFGVSDIAENIQETTIIKTHIEDAGTEGYNPHDKKITSRWDVYSIGCILNFILTGHTPDMDSYKKSTAIHNIIERATDDFSLRYSSVTELSKVLSHEAGISLWDRLPLLRSIPGYRSHTLWKSFIATSYYLLLIYLLGDAFISRPAFLLIVIPLWFFLPMLTVFDPFRIIPRINFLRKFRKNPYFLILSKTIAVIVYFILSVILIELFT